MWEEMLKLFQSGGAGATELLQGGASAGAGLDLNSSPAYAQLLGMQPDPNLGFMTMPQPSMQPQTSPLIQRMPEQQMMGNLMGPVGGNASEFIASAPPAAPAAGARPEAPAADGRKPLGFTADQAALLAKMAGSGQADQTPRPPVVGGGGVGRPQAPGMTQLGYGGYDPRKRATLGSLIYGR